MKDLNGVDESRLVANAAELSKIVTRVNELHYHGAFADLNVAVATS